MRRCRAIVIDGRKLIKNGIELTMCAVIAALIAFNIKTAEKSFDIENRMRAESIIDESIPVMSAASDNGDRGVSALANALGKLFSFVLTFDPYDMRTIVFGEVPLIKVVGSSYLAMQVNGDTLQVYNPQNADMGQGMSSPEMPTEGEYPIKAVDSGQSKALGKGKILIRNETDFGIDIEEMLSAPLLFDMKGSDPRILILHTHATEGYSPEGAKVYSPDKSDRSLEPEENVIKVGEVMKQVFEKNGINAIHDTTMHDHPNFNGSYANSLKTIEMYKTKYPGISVVLDIHRDAFIYDDGSKARFVTSINGKPTAQLMLVVGTNAGGLEHPNWRENMKLALKLQSYVSKKYPTLMRGVNLRKERFNGHMTYGSLIIEVGSSGNSMNEAILGAECGAKAIAEFFNTIK